MVLHIHKSPFSHDFPMVFPLNMVIFQAAKNQTPRPVGHAQDAADEALRRAGVASKRLPPDGGPVKRWIGRGMSGGEKHGKP